MIKRAILSACGAWFCGLCVGLALCFYDYGGRVYFALDFVPNAVILAGIFAAVAWLAAFPEKDNAAIIDGVVNFMIQHDKKEE